LIRLVNSIKNNFCQENFERFLEYTRISDYADYRPIAQINLSPPFFMEKGQDRQEIERRTNFERRLRKREIFEVGEGLLVRTYTFSRGFMYRGEDRGSNEWEFLHRGKGKGRGLKSLEDAVRKLVDAGYYILNIGLLRLRTGYAGVLDYG
jgi:hypothetical protein